jgi:hypothetical protein
VQSVYLLYPSFFAFLLLACCTRQGLNKKVHVRRQIVPALVGFKKQACPCRRQQQGFNGNFFNGDADDARGIQEGFFSFFFFIVGFLNLLSNFKCFGCQKRRRRRRRVVDL